MEQKKLSEVLTCAADLLQEKGWTQGWFARGEEDREVGWDSSQAVSYCMLGACYVCWGGSSRDRTRPIPAILEILDNNRKTSIASFNDRKGMTKERVIAKLRTLSRKAKRLEETGGATWE